MNPYQYKKSIRSVKKVNAGRKAKAQGAQIEILIERTLYFQGALVIPIPTGCKWIGPNKVTPVQTPFDAMAIKDGICLFFDIKTTSQTNFAHSQLTAHQVHWLYQIEKREQKAGYIVHFQKSDLVAFFSATQLQDLRPRESLQASEGLSLGTLKALDFSMLFK